MAKPLLTVGITCFNDEKYLRICIDSVLEQTYPRLEVIVVDDCSTDNSPAVFQQYGDRIRVIRHEKNSGSLTQGRRDVIAGATGEYIAHLDADDFLDPHYAERQISEFLSDPELDWVAPNLNVVDEHGRLTSRWDYKDFPSDAREGLIRGYHTASVPVPKNGLFKTAFLRRNNLSWYELPDTRQGEDALTCIEYLRHNPKIKLIPDYLLNYRVHGKNMSARPEERIKMVIGLKEHYIANLSEVLYLNHPALLVPRYNSPDYLALKFFMLSLDFYQTKNAFKVPDIFSNEQTLERVRDNLSLFDEPIRRYANESLSYSSRYASELDEILRTVSPVDTDPSGLTPEVPAPCKQGITRDEDKRDIQSYEDILAINPECCEALNGIGELLFVQGDKTRAVRYIRRAVEVCPDDPRSLNNAAVMAFEEKDFEIAEQHLRRALKADRSLPDTRINLCTLWGETYARTAPSQQKANEVLETLRWIADNAPDDERGQLLLENRQLRDSLVSRFANLLSASNERILLHRPGNGALKYLMDSWCEVLNFMGLTTGVIDWGENTEAAFKRFQPTVFITVADPAYIAQLDYQFISGYRATHGLRIGHISTFEHAYEPCDFLATFHLAPERDDTFKNADRPLISLPFGINPLRHYMKPGIAIWDYFFVGTNSPFKLNETKSYLGPILGKYRGILAGTNWNAGLGELQIKDAAEFYQFAQVYPNYHVARQMEEFNEVNEPSSFRRAAALNLSTTRLPCLLFSPTTKWRSPDHPRNITRCSPISYIIRGIERGTSARG